MGVLEVGIAQHPPRRALPAGGVEVAHQHDRGLSGLGEQPLGQQRRALLAGGLPGVVEVGDRENEILVGASVPHPRPHGDPRAVRVPAQRADPVRLLGEPQLVPVQQLEPVPAQQQEVVLAAAAALPADPEPQVGGAEGLVDHRDLRGEHLLQPHHVRLGLAEQLGEHRRPLGPVIGLPGQGRLVVIADVLGEDGEGGRLRCGGCHPTILAHA